jgi:hypothetical protein
METAGVRVAGSGRAARVAWALLSSSTGPVVTDSVTMPERWDGTTALEEVP